MSMPNLKQPKYFNRVNTNESDLKEESVDIDKINRENKEMKAQFSAYSTCAIPKKVTDFNYQMAVQRLLRHNKKKEHPTRRDYVHYKI